MNPTRRCRRISISSARRSIGMHFGTFQLTTEGIDEPLRALQEACAARNMPASQFRTLGFGDSLRVG